MRVECQRCGAISNTTDKEGHLCKDLAKRYERQKQAVNAVKKVLERYVHGDGRMTWFIRIDNQEQLENAALEIIKAIGARDNGL